MADLPETATYDAGVYQKETTDIAMGGPNGKANAGIRNLANRTAYLKQRVDAMETVVSQAEAEAGTATTLRGWTALRVRQAINVVAAAIIDSAPIALNTIAKLSAALGNDANFVTTITNLIGTKSSKTDVQGCVYSSAVAGGTADALTATFTPAITAIADQAVFVRAASVNATTTPTLTVNSLSPITLVKGNNIPLVPGDIAGAGHWLEITLDATLGKAVLANPATGISLHNNRVNDFRLTLSSGAALPLANVIGATHIYCTPFIGDVLSLFDGSAWIDHRSPEFSLALGTLINGASYDVFSYSNAGVPTLELSAAWTSTAARFASGPYATLHPIKDGVKVKSTDGTSVDATRRFMGSFTANSTTATEDSETTRYLSNYYNRRPRPLINKYTADRQTASGIYTEIHTEIRCRWMIGVADECQHADANGSNTSGASGNIATTISLDGTVVGGSPAAPGLGFNATTGGPSYVNPIAISGNLGGGSPISIGTHYLTLMGHTDGSGTGTWTGLDTTTKNVCYIHSSVNS